MRTSDLALATLQILPGQPRHDCPSHAHELICRTNPLPDRTQSNCCGCVPHYIDCRSLTRDTGLLGDSERELHLQQLIGPLCSGDPPPRPVGVSHWHRGPCGVSPLCSTDMEAMPFASLPPLSLCRLKEELGAIVQVAEVTTDCLRTTCTVLAPCRPNSRRRRGAVPLEYPTVPQEPPVTTLHLRGSALAPATHHSISFPMAILRCEC